MQLNVNAAQPIFLQRTEKCAKEKELEAGRHHGWKSSCWFTGSKVWIWLQLKINQPYKQRPSVPENSNLSSGFFERHKKT